MSAQPQVEIGKLFHIGSTYMFLLTSGIPITGIIQGANLLDSDWVIIVKTTKENPTHIQFHAIATWTETENETRNETSETSSPAC